MNNNVSGILLAAGESKRFGSNKLLHILPDSNTPIAVQAAKHLLEILPHSVAVVRPEDNKLKNLLLETGITLIDNPDAELGMSSSIRCAINYLSNIESHQQPGFAGFLIALADMPFIPSTIYQQVADEITQGELICAPQFAGKRGHPVGFSCLLMNELLQLRGDEGAKMIINKYAEKVKLVESKNKNISLDIDYPTDIAT